MPGSMRALQATGDLIRYSPKLHTFMLAYAEFLISCSEFPTQTQRRAELGRLAKRPVATVHVKALEQRKDFQAYLAELEKGPLAEARAKYMARLPKHIEAHDAGLDMAVAARDYKAIPTYTLPAIERVMPKKEVAAATQIAIVLSPERLAAFQHYEPPALEAVVDSSNETA